jgi:hypothetical protein
MSGGDHRWFKRRSTGEKRPVTGDNIIIIIITITVLLGAVLQFIPHFLNFLENLRDILDVMKVDLCVEFRILCN